MKQDDLQITLLDMYTAVKETNEQLKEIAFYLKEFVENVKELREEERIASLY